MIAKIEMRGGEPVITVDGRVYPPMQMTTQTEDTAYLHALGEAGIKIYYIICDTEWISPGSLERLTVEARRLLSAVPDAYMMLRIGLHPSDDWIKENPGELVTYNDGSHIPVSLYTESYHSEMPAMYSLLSDKWREIAAEKLSEHLDKIDKLPFSDRIIGYFLAAGGTSEWYYLSSLITAGRDGEPIYADCSEAFKREFSRFLYAKYGSNEALKKAWRRDDADIDNPVTPGLEARRFGEIDAEIDRLGRDINGVGRYGTTNYGVFLNADAYMDAADFYRAWNIGTANSVIYFAKALKQRYNGERLVGAFGGSYGTCSYLESSSMGGVVPILDSGYVDFLATPGVYNNRRPGAATAERIMSDSFNLRGRIFINEDDTRTHNDYFMARIGMQTFDAEDSVKVMKRDFGRNIAMGIHGWWFDQCQTRYRDATIYSLISEQQKIASELYDRFGDDGFVYDRPEIALIFDQESLGVASEDCSRELCDFWRSTDLCRIGAPYACHFHDDFALANMPDYKLYIFINCFALSDSDREVIHRALKKSGGAALWMYGQGIMNLDAETRFSAEHMRELTGFEVDCEMRTLSPRFKLVRDGDAILKRCDYGHVYGELGHELRSSLEVSFPFVSSWLNPYITVKEENCKILGRFGVDGKGALAIKRMDGWDSIICQTRAVRSDLLRSIAEYEGVHIYSYDDDILYAGRGTVTVHIARGGRKTLRFKRECSPYEAYEKRIYGERVSEISFDAEEGETKTFIISRNTKSLTADN